MGNPRVGHAVSSAHAEIDPRSATSTRRSRSLLRARGDRPDALHRLAHLSSSPPRTRRSTFAINGLARDSSVSSAHAEIDLKRIGRHHAQRSLLRARGDRPYGETSMIIYCGSPPRTRRSTFPIVGRIFCYCVSSAHAEIDPKCITSSRSTVSLLRARGDRPDLVGWYDGLRVSPPRTRRSTFPASPQSKEGYVSSAHAEIDRTTSTRYAPQPRLLRARGDRPKTDSCGHAMVSSPPRTRRSTCGRATPRRNARVSSAHAEIDPSRCAPRPRQARLLRARGDRPVSDIRGDLLLRSPPRTRRST